MRLGRSGPFAAWLAVVPLSVPAAEGTDPPPPPQAPATAGAAPQAAAPPALELAAQSPAAVAGCKLFQPGAKEMPAAECTGCHSTGHGGSAMAESHPVGVEYGVAQARSPNGLRPGGDVAKRGVALPNGKVECVTCHDAASPWASRIALPPGAVVIGRSDPRDPAAAGRPTPNWRVAKPSTTPPPPPGSVVVSAPLCAACHTAAD